MKGNRDEGVCVVHVLGAYTANFDIGFRRGGGRIAAIPIGGESCAPISNFGRFDINGRYYLLVRSLEIPYE